MQGAKILGLILINKLHLITTFNLNIDDLNSLNMETFLNGKIFEEIYNRFNIIYFCFFNGSLIKLLDQ